MKVGRLIDRPQIIEPRIHKQYPPAPDGHLSCSISISTFLSNESFRAPMNSTPTTISSNSQSMANSATPATTTAADGSGKKVRKPYTITKSRESWTEEEHDKFIEALQLFDRDWKKIEDFVGSKTVIQIRSHAQKYFLKIQKNGTIAHVPPPRPKRKAAHPYPQKAPKNVLVPLQASIAYPSSVDSLAPGYHTWDVASVLASAPSSGILSSEDEFNLHGAEADIGSKGATRIANSNITGIGKSSGTLLASDVPKQGKQAPLLHSIPDFSEVYSFIGSVFDPTTEGHVQKLKEMDPINFETVLLLMRNLTINLSSPDFESIKTDLSSYDVNSKSVGVATGNIANNTNYELPC